MATIPFKNVIFMMHNHLSLSTSTTHLSASASYSESDSGRYPSFKTFTIEYLTTKCGFPLKSAIVTSQKIDVNNRNIRRSDAFISLLKSHGFEDAHISKILQRAPKLLNHYRVDENLKPKLEFLVEFGFSGPLLHGVIVSCPEILATSLRNRIKPSLHFLRSFLGTEERVKMAVKRSSRLLTNNMKATLLPNIDLLLNEGVPLDSLRNFLELEPIRMQAKADRLVSALHVTKCIFNVRPTDPMFLDTVTRTASISDSLWEKKMQVFNTLGFSQEEAIFIFKRRPECLSLSAETLGTKLGFYFDTAKLKNDDIISYPHLIVLSLERRIRPRHNVLHLLMSKKLLKEDTKIAHIFVQGEKEFLNNYVTKHLQQVPSLLEMYNNDKAATTTEKK